MATIMALLGMAVGFITGRAYQAAQRAHVDWKKTKESVPLLFRIFLSLLGSAAGWILVAGVAAVVLIAWTVSGTTGHHTPKPAATVEPAKLTASPR
jgi:fatty acid desaturase